MYTNFSVKSIPRNVLKTIFSVKLVSQNIGSWYNCDAMGSLTRHLVRFIYLYLFLAFLNRYFLTILHTYLVSFNDIPGGSGYSPNCPFNYNDIKIFSLLILEINIEFSDCFFFMQSWCYVIYSTWLPIIGQKWTGILEIQSRRFADTIGRIKNQNEGFRAGT